MSYGLQLGDRPVFTAYSSLSPPLFRQMSSVDGECPPSPLIWLSVCDERTESVVACAFPTRFPVSGKDAKAHRRRRLNGLEDADVL